MTTQSPEHEWKCDPNADTVALELPAFHTAQTVGTNSEPGRAALEMPENIKKTIEFLPVDPASVSYEQAKHEVLPKLTEHKEQRTPLRVRLAMGVFAVGNHFWELGMGNMQERMARLRSGDLTPPPPTVRKAALGLGGAVVVASAVAGGIFLADIDQERSARNPSPVTAPSPSRGQQAIPAVPSEEIKETTTPEAILPTQSPIDEESIIISIPHPPVSRVPVAQSTPKPPKTGTKPSLPKPGSGAAAAQPTPRQTTVAPERPRDTSPTPNLPPKDTTKPERPATSSPPNTPPATPGSEQPPKTPTPTKTNQTSSPPPSTRASTHPPTNSEKPTTTSPASQSTTTIRPSASIKTNPPRTPSAPPQSKSSSSTSSFSATSIPSPESLRPSSVRSS